MDVWNEAGVSRSHVGFYYLHSAGVVVSQIIMNAIPDPYTQRCPQKHAELKSRIAPGARHPLMQSFCLSCNHRYNHVKRAVLARRRTPVHRVDSITLTTRADSSISPPPAATSRVDSSVHPSVQPLQYPPRAAVLWRYSCPTLPPWLCCASYLSYSLSQTSLVYRNNSVA